MTPIGPDGGEAAPFSHDGGGAPPARRLSWIPAIRGSAVLIIAWALRTRWQRGSRLGLSAGMAGLVAGLLVLRRHVLEPVVSARCLLDALGVSAVLTGTLRLLLLEGFKIRRSLRAL